MRRTSAFNEGTRRVRTVAGAICLALVAVVSAVTACDRADLYRNTAVLPAPSPVSPGSNSVGDQVSTVFGTAYAHTQTGRRPVPGLALRISGRWQDDTPFLTTVVTDPNGRYAVPGVKRKSAGISAEVQVDYLSPCSIHIWNWSDQPLDVHVVSRAELYAHGAPASIVPLEREVGYELVYAVSGRVTEGGPEESRPIGGALVEHFYGDGQTGDPTGFMLTDADGRYVVCAYWDDFGQAIRVTKDGYRRAIKTLGPSSTVDVDLTRD